MVVFVRRRTIEERGSVLRVKEIEDEHEDVFNVHDNPLAVQADEFRRAWDVYVDRLESLEEKVRLLKKEKGIE
jgi:hypothetical protein